MEAKRKIMLMFDTNKVEVYEYSDKLKLIKNDQLFFNETFVNFELYNKIDAYINSLSSMVGDINITNTRLFAKGIFQSFSKEEQKQLVVHVYTSTGLLFNIIQPDLERFYIKKSIESIGKEDVLEGLIRQEFRKIVICGSFQKHMGEISELVERFRYHNVEVLSPWTNEIIPETVGTDFILLKGQELINKRDSWRHKYDHMRKFMKADAVVICNPNGVIGQGTMFEFGFMIAHSKRVIFTEKPEGLSIMFPYEIGLNW